MYKGISLYIVGIAAGLYGLVSAVSTLPPEQWRHTLSLVLSGLLVGAGLPMIAWQVERNLLEELDEQEESVEDIQ